MLKSMMYGHSKHIEKELASKVTIVIVRIDPIFRSKMKFVT